MVTLTEEMIIARTKISNLESITKLNFCSRELSDVSILQKMKNVTVLSLSVNNIDSLEVFQVLTKLEELFLRKNRLSNLNHICYLQSLPELQSLWLQDNPCAANEEEYRLAVIRALPRLKKLDNILVETSEIERAQRLGKPLIHPEDNYSESEEDEPYFQSQREQPHERSPSPEEVLYHQEINNPYIEPHVQMPPKTKEYNNSYEMVNNGGYTNEVEEPKEIHNEPPANQVYQNHRQAAPAYIKYEEDVSSVRQQNHRSQGILPRSRTAVLPFQRDVYQHSGQQKLCTCQTTFLRTDGELGHYSCPNYCAVTQPGHRRPIERRTNVLNAVLCLIKELDYPNLEVVHMAVKCRMEDLCDSPIQ